MMTTLLRRLRAKPKARLDVLNVTVYTRAQCCCCHKALDVLSEYQTRHGFAIETIDVDSDPELVAKYGLSVPVVAIDGKVRFKGAVNPVLLNRLMTAELAKQGR
jgi:glutaredoxin